MAIIRHKTLLLNRIWLPSECVWLWPIILTQNQSSGIYWLMDIDSNIAKNSNISTHVNRWIPRNSYDSKYFHGLFQRVHVQTRNLYKIPQKHRIRFIATTIETRRSVLIWWIHQDEKVHRQTLKEPWVYENVEGYVSSKWWWRGSYHWSWRTLSFKWE